MKAKETLLDSLDPETREILSLIKNSNQDIRAGLSIHWAEGERGRMSPSGNEWELIYPEYSHNSFRQVHYSEQKRNIQPEWVFH